MSILAAAVPAEYEAPGVSDFWQPLIGSGSTAITRACFVAAISVVVILWFLLATTKKKALVPSKGQMATETVYGLVRNGVARDLIGSKEFLRFVPLLFSLVHVHPREQPLRRDPADPVPDDEPDRVPHRAGAHLVDHRSTSSGFRKHGFIGYWKSLVPSGLPGGMVVPIFFLELITDLFTRPVTLALRLFGNMFAGHILIVLFITGGWYMLTSGGILLPAAGAVTWVFGFVMTLFELLVEFLQAYVFTLLTALYIAGAVADEH